MSTYDNGYALHKALLRGRKLPTYHDLESEYSGRGIVSFEFDHRAPSRGKYRKYMGMRVYESGYTEVEPYVHRNPSTRNQLGWMHGLVFRSPADCYKIKFFTPDNMPVAASAIKTGMLFLDGQTRRAYSYEHWWSTSNRLVEEARIDFAAPGAVPVTNAQVRADLANPERVKAVMQEYKEFFKMCATTMLLLQGTIVEAGTSVHSSVVLEMMLRGEPLDFAAMPLYTKMCIGEHVAGKAEVGIRARLTALSVKPCVFPYLNIDVGDGNG